MRFRFGRGPFRVEPLDSLLEARREDDTLECDHGDAYTMLDASRVCGAFAFECLMKMLDHPAREGAENWLKVTREEPVWGARNAARHLMDCMGEREWAEKALLRLCEGE
jgi:hypothetical protein